MQCDMAYTHPPNHPHHMWLTCAPTLCFLLVLDIVCTYHASPMHLYAPVPAMGSSALSYPPHPHTHTVPDAPHGAPSSPTYIPGEVTQAAFTMQYHPLMLHHPRPQIGLKVPEPPWTSHG